jgi:hypothetical protein
MVWIDEAQYFTPYAQELLQKRGPPPPESDPVEFNQRLVELRKLHEAGGRENCCLGQKPRLALAVRMIMLIGCYR